MKRPAKKQPNSPPERVSLRMVAERAGVHHSTVSLALRGSPLIAEKTKARVQAIARDLGYVPDPVLSALNAYRQQRRPSHQSSLGWLTYQHEPGETPWHGVKLYREYHEGASARAASLGYRVEEFAIKTDGYTPESLMRVLTARGVQGLLVCPQRGSGEPIPSAFFTEFSAVKFGYSWFETNLNAVTNHHFVSVAKVLKRLRRLGYRRIGIALPMPYHRNLLMQLMGAYWVDYHQQPEEWRVEPMQAEDWGADSLKRWLEEQKPEAVVSDHVTIGGLLETIGWPVPQRVALASIGLAADETRYAGIYQNNHLIGEVAMDALSAMIHHNQKGLRQVPQNVLLEGEWRDGPSAPGIPR